MPFPVVVMNPRKAKGKSMARRRKRRRRRNPKLDLMGVGMASLGAVALAAIAYAIDGQNLTKKVAGAIEVAAGLVVGTGVSMISPALGCGIVGAGVGIGVYNAGSEILEEMASAPADKNNNANNNNANTNAIRAQLGAVRAQARMLPQSQQRAGFDLSRAAQQMSAIRARL